MATSQNGDGETPAEWTGSQTNLSQEAPGRFTPTTASAVRKILKGRTWKAGTVMSQDIIKLVEQGSLKENPPQFDIGDTVDVHCLIHEGEKTRTQVFSGTVIGRSGGGAREMFTVRRIVAGEGVERKFPVHSPRIAKVEVKRSAVVRRAKLYFLRDRVGKATRLRERRR